MKTAEEILKGFCAYPCDQDSECPCLVEIINLKSEAFRAGAEWMREEAAMTCKKLAEDYTSDNRASAGAWNCTVRVRAVPIKEPNNG